MNSFARNLVISFSGIIFIGFLAVYFSFNALIDRHISTEAEQVLSAFTLHINEPLPPFILAEQAELHYDGEIGVLMPTHQLFTSQPVEQSFLNLGIILLDSNNEVISPLADSLAYAHQREIEFLIQHYISNQADFENEAMIFVLSENSAYYMRVMQATINENIITFLLHTDISSVVGFKDSMNLVLAVLLSIVGVFALAVSVSMSVRFKRTILKLCGYADTIGHGNFQEATSKFGHSEFERLSTSMSKMASMLKAYDDKQKQFFENASHELRTPLMSIQGYAVGITENVFDKDEAAEIIFGESAKMETLVDGIMYISRMDSGLEVTNAIFMADIRNLLNDCYERLRIVAEKLNTKIIVNTPEHEVSIRTDDKKLDRAISNILSNAIRHAQTEIHVSCIMLKDGVEITIQDDGQGIAENDIPNIFDRFYKGKNGNSGLGLAICKDIVENLGGTITAQNLPHPKQGAVFTITLYAE